MDESEPIWRYEEYFTPPQMPQRHPVVLEAEEYVNARHLELHPFFDIAVKSPEALRIWVTQEIVMTNPFSQIVLKAASLFKNVHLRAMLNAVALGEHGHVKNGIAKASHPWLLHQLRESLSIPTSDVYPYPETIGFLQGLSDDCKNPIEAVAAIGVGNERLIIPEYDAIKRCFAACCPDADYRPFLDANINEDVVHSDLLYDVASCLIMGGASPKTYIDAAVRGVDRRYQYFDRLYDRAKAFRP